MKKKLNLSLENLKQLVSANTVVGGTDTDTAAKEAGSKRPSAVCLLTVV